MAAIDFTPSTQPPVASGIDRCVLYSQDIWRPWFGIVGIETDNEFVGQTITYQDGFGQRSQVSLTDFSAVVSCYQFPDEVEELVFGMSYRVYTNLERTEYELHLVYNCIGALDGLSYVTTSDQPSVMGFSIRISTRPNQIPIKGYQPGTHLIIRSDSIWEEALKAIEDVLYGNDTDDPRLPSIDETIEILETYVELRITDHGDGSWTAEEINTTGIINMIDGSTFEIDSPSAKFIDHEIYTIHSF